MTEEDRIAMIRKTVNSATKTTVFPVAELIEAYACEMPADAAPRHPSRTLSDLSAMLKLKSIAMAGEIILGSKQS